MVEHQLPKLRVAGSNPVVRFRAAYAPWPAREDTARTGDLSAAPVAAIPLSLGRTRQEPRRIERILHHHRLRNKTIPESAETAAAYPGLAM